MVKNYWENLDPKHKRYVAIFGGAGLLIGAIAIFAGDPPERTGRKPANGDTIRHVLTDRDTRDVSIEGLAAQMQRAEQQNTELRRELGQLRTELDREGRTGIPREVQRDLSRLANQVESLETQNQVLFDKSEKWSQNAVRPVPEVLDPTFSDVVESESDDGYVGSTNARPETTPPKTTNPDVQLSEEEIFSRRQTSLPSAAVGQQGAGEDGEVVQSGMQIISYYEKNSSDVVSDDDETDGVYIPAASIMTGVLLNGMDAPTNQGSRRDPFPAAMRLQHDAILPNYFSADVKECFLLISGYGDLSTERAYLRGETISCVREDGGVIEAQVDGYAVGEDGKAGIRGTLVSKQGSLIARSMLAGFASGASQAFDVNPIPVIQTENIGGSQQYQSNYNSSMLQGAAAQGTSRALEKVADFYIEMAESIFPVIEVDAGRQVEVILTRGVNLKFTEADTRRG